MLRVAVNYQRQLGVRKAKNLSLIRTLQNQSEDNLNRTFWARDIDFDYRNRPGRKYFKGARREGFSEAHEAKHHQEEKSPVVLS